MLLSDSPLQQAAREHLLLHFSRNGSPAPLLVLERGEGPYVFDTEGNRYLDGLSSLFCAQIGYSYGEELASVAAAQLQKLAFSTVWGAAHPAAIELSERLAEIMPGDLDHVFFTSGGSESVESAWKLVRQYHVANGEPQRTKAIARDRAYHGVTLGALSFTGVPNYKEQFGPPAIPVTHVANTNPFRGPADGEDEAAFCARLLAEIEGVIQDEGPDTIAMIIMEPVQNAGGCLTPPEGYWQGLRDIADRHGILLVSDEVICGFGRLGEWLGVERFGVTPGPRDDGEGAHLRLRADGRRHGQRPRRGAALRRPEAHAHARDHVRRAPAVRRDRAAQPRGLRARRDPRERPRAASRTCSAA